jgi:hypothetical protein
VPIHNLRRRLAALERQVPEPAPRSELAELLAYMSLDELDMLHDIAERVDANGNVRAEDVPQFGRIYLAATERRNAEPNLHGNCQC